MTEVMVCLAIAAALSAILLPVVAEARNSSKRSVSASNLRQIHMALSIYRAQASGDGVFGSASRMGLPPDLKNLGVSQNMPKSLFRSGCPTSQAPVLKVPLFRVMWHEDGDPTMQDWEPYATELQGNAVLLGDENCDFGDRAHENPMVSHRGIGLYEAGHVQTVVKKGSSLPYGWWN